MTSVLGALWTGLQGIGWLLYFLHQLITDTLNINYRLVSAVGHLITGTTKLLYALSSSVSLALYEVLSYLLLKVVGICTFVIDCLYFVVHCCTLLFKIVYFTVSGVANGLFFVLLMPICACQTLHSWIIWIFNAERWLNAAAWCLQTCSFVFSLVGETTWRMILYSVITISGWISSVAVFTYEYMTVLCFSTYNGFLSLCAGITTGIAYIPFHIWSFTLLQLDFLYDCVLDVLVNSVHCLRQLNTVNYLCLITISLSLLVLLFLCGCRLLWRYFRHSTGEVIRIHLNDVDEVIEVSDDERDDFRDNAADVFDFEEDEDTDVESGDEESNMTDTTEGISDDDDDVSDTVSIDSDQETIDVQLPDQPTTSMWRGGQHGYATRSKGNINHLQQCLDQERERSLCVICQDQVKSVLVLPCRHMCMCVDCARTVVSGSHGQRRICPLCRSNIRMVMNVYT